MSNPSTNESEYWMQAAKYMEVHHEIPILCTIFYLVVVFGGREVMKNREPFHLKTLLGFWNVVLAVFSVAGAVFTLPPIIDISQTHGITIELCTSHAETAHPWVFFFCLSKIPEFVDTFFIVLRKKPLRFLHWYHHIATMAFCWYAWAHMLENGGAFAAMNLVVHSIMYSYYAASEFGVRFPQPIRISITGLQILQMLLGTIIILHNIIYCNSHPVLTYLGLAMYISYAVLFIQLFVNSYCGGKNTTEGKKEKEH